MAPPDSELVHLHRRRSALNAGVFECWRLRLRAPTNTVTGSQMQGRPSLVAKAIAALAMGAALPWSGLPALYQLGQRARNWAQSGKVCCEAPVVRLQDVASRLLQEKRT